MKKRSRLIACMVAGVLVLAVSATAAFGSANGYSSYKKAVLDLALQEKNFTAKGNMDVNLDGKSIGTIAVDYAQDGANRFSRMHKKDDVVDRSYVETTLNGVTTYYNEADKTYSQYNTEGTAPTNLMGVYLGSEDGEFTRRMVNFMELGADTIMGDLKNNFVQIGSEGGKDLYEVNISGSQVPPLLNSALSLMAYSVGTTSSDVKVNYIEYENHEETTFHYYEKVTGETLSQEFKDGYYGKNGSEWMDKHMTEIDKFNRVMDEQMYDEFQKVLDQKGGTGILYVKVDGTYDYYPTEKEYLQAHPDQAMNHLDYYVSKDMKLDAVSCTFAIDDESRLVNTKVEMTFLAVDQQGTKHTLKISGQADVADYGKTKISPLDVGDRVRQDR